MFNKTLTRLALLLLLALSSACWKDSPLDEAPAVALRRPTPKPTPKVREDVLHGRR